MNFGGAAGVGASSSEVFLTDERLVGLMRPCDKTCNVMAFVRVKAWKMEEELSELLTALEPSPNDVYPGLDWVEAVQIGPFL
jgi:hypothetical protein